MARYWVVKINGALSLFNFYLLYIKSRKTTRKKIKRKNSRKKKNERKAAGKTTGEVEVVQVEEERGGEM
jgi:hypothetical protein